MEELRPPTSLPPIAIGSSEVKPACVSDCLLPDPYWNAVAEFLKARCEPCDLIVAPRAFRAVLPGVLAHDAPHWLLPASVAHFVLHKGNLHAIDPETIDEARTWIPTFANEVFVVFSRRGEPLPVERRVHFVAFEERLASLRDGDASLRPVLKRPAVHGSKVRPHLHILFRFVHAVGGGENHALHLARALRDFAEVTVWDIAPPGPSLRGHEIEVIDFPAGHFPQGGTLIVMDCYYRLAEWIRFSNPERLILYLLCPPEAGAAANRFLELAAHVQPEIATVSGGLLSHLGVIATVQYPALDLGKFQPVAKPRSERFLVGRMSRDHETKHYLPDVALYRRLAEADFRVQILGGTFLQKSMDAELAKAPSAARGIELLPCRADAVPEFLQQLDCFYYRTNSHEKGGYYEGAGLVIAEAMACGVPVVAYRKGGYAEWIEHGTNGFLFGDDDDPFELIVALRNDPTRAREIGTAARARAERLFGGELRERMLRFFLGDRS